MHRRDSRDGTLQEGAYNYDGEADGEAGRDDDDDDNVFHSNVHAAQKKRLRQFMMEEGMIYSSSSNSSGNSSSSAAASIRGARGGSLGGALLHPPSDNGAMGGAPSRMFVPGGGGQQQQQRQEQNQPATVITGVRPGGGLMQGIMARAQDWLQVGNDVVGRSRQRAAQYLTLIFSNATAADSESLKKMMQNMDSDMTPVEFGGHLNADAQGEHYPPVTAAPNVGPRVFSRAFLDSMRSNEQFVVFPGMAFITVAAFIDLCRCPAILCTPGPMVAEFLLFFIKTEEQLADPDELAFQTWYRDAQGILSNKGYMQDLETTKMLFSTGAFIQRQVSRMRSSFSLSEQQEVPADVRRELDTFFNMDYEPWINTLYELHVLPSIKREYTREQILHQMFSTLQPMRSIGDMVAKATALQSQGGSSTDDAAVESQRQDLYYASLVHGAAVKTPMAEVWCPDQELEHSDRDTDAFFKVMWRGLKDVLETSVRPQLATLPGAALGGASGGGNNAAQQQQQQRMMMPSGAEFVDQLVKSIRRVKETKRLMKEIWEQSKNYRVSDRIHMTEIQILQRLKNDGVFPWVDRASLSQHMTSKPTPDSVPLQNAHVCFFMRRTPELRYAFAAAVGKRYYSERMGGTHKSAIIEHHRSVGWAEKEYANLLSVVQDNYSAINELLGSGWLTRAQAEQTALFNDYCGMLHPIAHVSQRDIAANLNWGF